MSKITLLIFAQLYHILAYMPYAPE